MRLTFILGKEKVKSEHGETLTFILGKEKVKSEHGEYVHVHFE